MKVLFGLLAVVSFSISALAFEGHHAFGYSQRFSTRVVTGVEAKQIWNRMTTPVIPGDSLRTFSSAYRVERSVNGLDQTVCTSRHSLGRSTETSCSIQSSQDGLPLRPFVKPPRRLG